MNHSLHRRDMLKTAAVVGSSYWLSSATPAESAAPSEKLNIACIGIGGRGSANLNGVSSQNILALCDVDDQRAGKAYEKFPKAKKYIDFRRMLDEMDKQIDAVVISTPDHTHFHPGMMAMNMGKHLYCEKPMAHSVFETRAMTNLAREKKIATQLGVQRHTLDNMHRVVELIQAGAIGKITEVHSWIGGNRGMPGAVTKTPKVPSHLNWDLWVGPAKMRPYSPSYCPYNWRFWWDFGTGETGNFGCHILDIPYWALDLKYPTKVDASGPEVHDQMTSKSMTTRFEFPSVGSRGPVTLHWYHAKNGPPILKKKGLSNKGANTLFIGSEGMLLCGFGMRKLYPEEKFKDFTTPDKSIAKSPGFYREWFDACKGGPAATCNFDYSGPLTETVLLGNAAYRGGGFDWDSKKLESGGNSQVDRFLRPEFRKGWEV